MKRTLHRDRFGRLSHRVFLDDPRLQELLAILNTDGEQARVVGGAVRNALIGAPPGDIDIATTAVPEVVIARAKAAKLRSIPTGIAHGTITVVVAGIAFEVTTLREDVETNGRHAVVRFGRDFAADALRRDFTINALSVDVDGTLHDYTNGLDDLEAGQVRFIGDSDTRIREDYLRILRFFRFSAFYSTGPLDAAGLEASRRNAEGMQRLSRERVRAELVKLLLAPRAPDVLIAMEEFQLLEPIIGLPCRPRRFERLVQIMALRGMRPDAMLSLAALAVTDDRAPERLRDALRLSNEERNRLERLAARMRRSRDSAAPPDAHALSALLFAEGRQTAVDVVTLWHVDSNAPSEDVSWQAAARFAASAAVPTLPVSGSDIMARGIRSGPMVGQVLKELQALWIRAGFPDNPSALHRLLDEAIETSRPSSV